MYNVSDDFIGYIGHAGKERDIKITIGNNEIIPQRFKHSFAGNIFTSIMQTIEFEVKNGNVIAENTVLKPQYGLKVFNKYEYINYSNYNVYSSEINYDTNIVKTVAYDNLIKFMKKYEVAKLNIKFPTTIVGLITAICNYIGVQLYNADFFNADLVIEGDLFTALNCTYRDVINYVCQATLTTAIIKDNKLYFKSTTNTNKTMTPAILKKLKIKQEFGGCNSLVLGRGDLNDNIYSKDDTLIVQEGLQEIRFDNNEIIDKKREHVIDNMFNQIKGLKYYSFETKDLGIGIFEPADFCNMQDLNDNTYKVLVLNQSITISSGCEGAMSASIPITASTKYQYATDSEKRQFKTEIIVDKQNQKIEAVVENVDEQNNKISQAIQTLDELRSSISDIADLTVSAENYNAKVILENINESEPIRVVVRPVGEDISYLYPRDNLYPSDDLYLKNRRIRFATDTYSTEWELPDDLLYYDAENYDELILDYEGQSCIINKKVEYNADGSKKLLDKPITVEYPYPKIELKDGDYTVSLLGYNTGYLFVRLMSQNIYTTQFATKAEVGSQIKQTTQDINLGVNEKLKNYSTTQETNSAINLKANEIASTISGTYATKGELSTTKTEIKQTTDNLNLEVSKKLNNSDFTSANIMLAINNDTSEVKINADKIDIDGKAVHFKTELSKTIGPFTKQDFDKVVDYVRNGTELTVKEFEKYDFDGDGEIHLIDAQIIAMAINNGGYYTFSGTYEIDPYSTSKSIALRNSQGEYQAIISLMYNFFDWLNVGVLESSSNNGNITTSIGSGHASFNDSDLSNSITIGVSRGEDRRTPSIELYKNDNGQKTLSLSPEEINIQWGHVLASHNLYNNTSGSTGTITLSESSANFSYLEIFYGKNQSTLHSVKVVNPNGKRACLTLAFYDIANSFVQMQVPKAIISGTTIMKEATGGANIYSGNTEAFTANEVAIFKVVGYK